MGSAGALGLETLGPGLEILGDEIKQGRGVRWSVPGGCPRVMIHIVSPSQVINPPFPPNFVNAKSSHKIPLGETAILVFKGRKSSRRGGI